MDKAILVQYCEMKEEIKDLRRRIQKLDRFLENPPIVADVVKGTRRDGTFGPIKVTGIPEPEYIRKQGIRERYKRLLEVKEAELLELTCQAEETERALWDRFNEFDSCAEMNQLKVLQAMQESKVSEACLYGTTGYGYNDRGRTCRYLWRSRMETASR